MAKILVADDNSNVQKTVALALADLGVEIISVNNGEAAVRKLPDVLPDLVLADIFMPVRNGYEVCEFVKKDSRFARVPVVLLVGAFDPFDEREAQRVGADGILKKPFVPPEPLITMIKTLLDRSLGERLVAVSASKPAATVQAKSGGTAVAELPTEPPEPEESSSQEFPSPLEQVAFGEGERPVAFGQLLETPAEDGGEAATAIASPVATSPAVLEPVDDEQILTSSRPSTLGDPVFWKNEVQEDASDTAEAEGISSFPAESRTWDIDEDALPRREESDLLQPAEPLELVRDDHEELPLSVVDSQSILLDAAAQAPLTVEAGKPPDLAANPLEWMATAPPLPLSNTEEATPEWDESIPEAVEAIDKVESLDHPKEPAPVAVESPAQISVPILVPVTMKPDAIVAENAKEPTKPAAAIAEDSKPPITALSVIPAPPPAPPPAIAPPITPLPPAMLPKPEIVQSASSERTTDTARSIPVRDWADLTTNLDTKLSAPTAPQIKPAAALPVQPPAAISGNAQPSSQAVPAAPKDLSANPELVEAVVQRVLEKMRPQVVDIITREFLRPVVQALVHKEIEKK